MGSAFVMGSDVWGNEEERKNRRKEKEREEGKSKKRKLTRIFPNGLLTTRAAYPSNASARSINARAFQCANTPSRAPSSTSST
jgi:hypothetical protein